MGKYGHNMRLSATLGCDGHWVARLLASNAKSCCNIWLEDLLSWLFFFSFFFFFFGEETILTRWCTISLNSGIKFSTFSRRGK